VCIWFYVADLAKVSADMLLSAPTCCWLSSDVAGGVIRCYWVGCWWLVNGNSWTSD
jgi:hypothetical protein